MNQNDDLRFLGGDNLTAAFEVLNRLVLIDAKNDEAAEALRRVRIAEQDWRKMRTSVEFQLKEVHFLYILCIYINLSTLVNQLQFL